jgi:hypothetical protein
MAYRKIVIAVDCANENEAAEVQRIAQEVSSIFRLKAADLISVFPMIKKNGNVIITALRTISQEGMRGVALTIPYLIKNLKK